MNLRTEHSHCGLSRRRYALGWLLFCALLSGTVFSSLHRLSTGTGDFNQFIDDGRRALATDDLGEALPLRYPPTTRPLFMLMASPPTAVAAIIWWALSAGMYWQCAVWLSAGFRSGKEDASLLPAFCLIGLALAGIVSDLSVGQLTGIVLFCVVGSFEMDRRERPVLGGMLLAVSLLVKPLPLLLLPYYLLRRRWAFLASVLGTYVVLGPLLLTVWFGWETHVEGWRWFTASTAQPRSPLNVFGHVAEQPGTCWLYRKSGLASSMIRLFMDVKYDRAGHSVQIATLRPRTLLAMWLLLVGAPSIGAAWRAWRCRSAGGLFHTYAAFTGIMLLANPHFISYWLAVPMVTAAPLAARAWIARRTGTSDPLSLAALAVWIVGSASVGVPIMRAAGSFPLSIYFLTVANLIHAARPWPAHGCPAPSRAGGRINLGNGSGRAANQDSDG